MARIPGVPDPTVNEAPLPTPYERPFATPEAQGAGLGTELTRAGGVAEDLAREWRQKADTSAVLGAQAQAKAAYNDLILDPVKGYSSLRGADAMKGRDAVLQKFNQRMQEISQGLSNDEQRLHFAQTAKAIQQQGYAHVASHEGLEQERYMQAQFRGNLDQTMVTMENPATVSDPAALKAQIDSLFQAGIDEAKRRYGQNASKDAVASVVVPELQKAALGTMEAAISTQDPTIAKAAFDQVGKYMVTNHQRFYAGLVEKLSTQAAVASQTRQIISSSAVSVPIPGGDPIAHIDGTQVAAKVAALPPETPHLGDIIKSTETEQARQGKVWEAATGTILGRVGSAALLGGGFDLDRAKPQDVEWLRVNAYSDLLKLRQQETKANSKQSEEAFSGFASDLAAHRDVYVNMSVPELEKHTLDLGMNGKDRVRALKLFQGVQQGQLAEKINQTVGDELKKAFEYDQQARDQLHGRLLDATTKFVDTWKASTEGKVPPTEKIREFVASELVAGKVGDVHWYWDPRMRRIEYETTPEYKGKPFTPLNSTGPAPQPPVTAATPVPRGTIQRPTGFAGYRSSPDGKTRFPADAQGKRLGPDEPAP